MSPSANRSTFAAKRILALGTFWGLVLFGAESRAEVVRIEIRERVPFADGVSFADRGPYEKISGRLHYEVDPQAVANERVADLKWAPRNDRRRVEFAADFCLLRPVDPRRGNRRLLYDVNNRGNKLALGAFNDRGGNNPLSAADAGNGFLMRQGYAVLWTGWNGDVLSGGERMRVDLPVAQAAPGQSLAGAVYCELCTDGTARSQPLVWGNSRAYPPISLDTRQAVLTRRRGRNEPAVAVPAADWAFARWENGTLIPDDQHLYLKAGFETGALYELVYQADHPRVTGLGFVGVRDAVAFFRYAAASDTSATNPLAGAIDHAYVFGISQSARFIHHFIYEDFNADPHDRLVFDGALTDVGGGGRGLFNGRFVQTTRHGSPYQDNLYPSDAFPLTTTESHDPVTGQRGDWLDRARRAGHLPKIVFTDTSTEYWCRGCSLLHTDVTGTRDVPLDPNCRLYFIAGAQHGSSSSTSRGHNQNAGNTLDHRPPLRALLVALDRWVSDGREPPESRYPRIADGTLVSVAEHARQFPKLPGVGLPRACYAPLRLDLGPRWATEGIADYVPPKTVGPPYVTLVPAVDADGNERAGVRLPEVAVPLATFAGWNLRAPEIGAAGELARLAGSRWPLPVSTTDGARAGDPRRPIVERYATRDAYVERVRQVAERLRDEGFLLAEDVDRIVAAAPTKYDQAGH